MYVWYGPTPSHPTPPPDSTRKAYYREFRKVVEAADVVLEVLDARDPLGCRCPQVRGEGRGKKRQGRTCRISVLCITR